MSEKQQDEAGREPESDAPSPVVAVRPSNPDPQVVDEDADKAEFLAAMAQDFEVRESGQGEMVNGTVVSIGDEFAFVEVGGKSEAMISLEEFHGPGEEAPKVGDSIEACVVSSHPMVLSRRLAKGIRDREFLVEAARNKIPVEGRVISRNKGGFDVEVAGVRAFCPVSQIELRYCEEPDEHVGQRYTFVITKYEGGSRRPDIVLSRKALLQAEAERAAAELRKTLKPLDVVSGTVRKIIESGAFVDLGGLDGFLPISELSYGRVDKVRDVVQEGEELHIQVMAIEPARGKDRERISLSLKRLEADPWEETAGQFAIGSRQQGRVVRLAPFGAFVELAPGVDGLIHISNFNAPERISHPSKIVSEGQTVTVEVIAFDPESRRIGLARVPSEGEFGNVPVVGDVVEGKVDKVAPFGVFVTLGPGRKGLVPNSELGTPKGSDARREFSEGSPMRVLVLEVTENGKRIRLSRKAALDAAERADFEAYLGGGEEQQVQSGFGTLGDLLKKKLQ